MTTLKIGDFIKHQTSMDVAIRIHKVDDLEHKVIIQGVWWNQGYKQSFNMGYPVTFEIKRRHLTSWLICDNPNSKCIRYEKWLTLS